jgi:hypothetical protein
MVVSWAPLLSGDLNACQNASDPTCKGGVAAVAAYLRYYNNLYNSTAAGTDHTGNDNLPITLQSIVLPYLDKSSAFVQMHPLEWNMNRIVFHNRMGWNVLLSSPAILTEQRDLSALQSAKMPLLLTNVAVPPSNSWYWFTQPIYFDSSTKLAFISIDSSGSALNVDQVQAASGSLDYIARISNGCSLMGLENSTFYDNENNAWTTDDDPNFTCWIPVVIYADLQESFDTFVASIVDHRHPPAVIFNALGSSPIYAEPTLVQSTWVHTYRTEYTHFNLHRLDISDSTVSNVTFTSAEFASMPDAAKDEQYASDIAFLRTLADQALDHDPIVGYTGFMPMHRDDGDYRRCIGGECELGNLFTDALRWQADADVAFVTSGGLRGPGWPAGPVRVSDLWAALPFANTMCTGNMTGVSLFKLFNVSISMATFQPIRDDNGDDLLQVSGMRLTYNTRLKDSRLVSMEVWDKIKNDFFPIERLRLYTFATDSFLCQSNDPFPELLGSGLLFEGESPGKTSEMLHQDIVAHYLEQLGGPYNTSIQNRLVNNTNANVALNLIQNEDECGAGTFWDEKRFTCEPCPTQTSVYFLTDRIEFQGDYGSEEEITKGIEIINGEAYNLSLLPKSVPPWLLIKGISRNGSMFDPLRPGEKINLLPSEKVSIDLVASLSGLETGNFTSSVSFSIFDGLNFLGCAPQDVSVEARARVFPDEELNQLGSASWIGWVMVIVVSLSSFLIALWVLYNRNSRIVKTMQPLFLVVVCAGVFIIGLSIIPVSIDDGIASEHACDMACMSIPWLLSMGFVLEMSALIAKLWRINKLFDSGFRRVVIRERDVLAPFAVLMISNVTLLVAWTVVDPLRWERTELEGQPWFSYGACRTNGAVGPAMFGLVAAVNILALSLTCYQAYRARHISDEFSESKRIGIALFSWFQLLIVGVPVIFLIDPDNVIARYFIVVSLIFLLSMAMLLLIFVPIMVQLQKFSHSGTASTAQSSTGRRTSSFAAAQVGRTRISGIYEAKDSWSASESRDDPVWIHNGHGSETAEVCEEHGTSLTKPHAALGQVQEEEENRDSMDTLSS